MQNMGQNMFEENRRVKCYSFFFGHWLVNVRFMPTLFDIVLVHLQLLLNILQDQIYHCFKWLTASGYNLKNLEGFDWLCAFSVCTCNSIWQFHFLTVNTFEQHDTISLKPACSQRIELMAMRP